MIHQRHAFGTLALCGVLVVLFCAGCQSFQNGTGAKKKPFGISGMGKNRLSPDPDELLDPLGARNPNRVTMYDLAPNQISTTMKTMRRGKVDEAGAEKAYKEGQELYKQAIALREQEPDGKEHIALLEKAANSFRLAGHKWPDSALHQDAMFFQGESFFFADRYVQANRAYESLIAQYSGSRYFDRSEERRFTIARYWLGRAREQSKMEAVKYGDPSRPIMGMAGEARRILHRIRLDDPTGKLADDATMQLAAAFMEVNQFQEAADAFEDLRRSYPGSPHLFNAHLFELKCRMNCYYGPSYEAEPLKKSDDLIRQIVRQFPEEAARHEQYLAREATLVRNQMAERDFSLGEYYQKRGENRAAQVMYAKVEQDFSETQVAASVDEKLEAVLAGPPVPVQHAQWLVDVFPKSDAAKPLIASGDKEGLLR